MKYKIGDILCYEATLEGNLIGFTHFIITDAGNNIYHVMCLDDEVQLDESYNVSWIDNSPKWNKVSE